MDKAEKRFIGWLMLIRIYHEKYLGCNNVKLDPDSWRHYYVLGLNVYETIKMDLEEQP